MRTGTPKGDVGPVVTGRHQAILDAVRAARDDRPDVAVGFCEAALRRVPHHVLDDRHPEASAAVMLEAFDHLDHRTEPVEVRVEPLSRGLDGSTTAGTAVLVSAVDRPFVLTTLRSELDLRRLTPVLSLHPIVGTTRHADGHIVEIEPARGSERRESLIYVELEQSLSEDDRADLASTLQQLYGDVVRATDDFDLMADEIGDLASTLRAAGDDESREVADFLDWLVGDAFVLLGVRRYEVVETLGPGGAAEPGVVAVAGSGGGILADTGTSALATPVPLSELSDEQRTRFLHGPDITVSRTNRRSTVHRRSRMTYIGVRQSEPSGATIGEFRILGLFTDAGAAESVVTTPVLRRRIRRVLEQEDVVPGSHDETMLLNLLQAVPKQELLESTEEELHATVVALLEAEEHGDVRVVVRSDRFTRSVSVLVAVPRDRYSPILRERLTELFLERFQADRADVELSLGERAEALVRFSLHLPGELPDVSVGVLQREVRELARNWIDDVREVLAGRVGAAGARTLTSEIAERLPRAYRDRQDAVRAADEIQLVAKLLESDRALALLIHGADAGPRLVAAHQGGPLILSEFLPILESVGLTVLEELLTELSDEGAAVHLHDFGLQLSPQAQVVGEQLINAIHAIWSGSCEIDSLNRLVTAAGLGWRQVAVLRAYRRFGRQIGIAYSSEYVHDALVENPDASRGLIDYFEARFGPGRGEAEEARARERVLAACDAVVSLDHDRIIRRLIHMIDATLRTNAFSPDPSLPLALKFDSQAIPFAPAPRPHREIFVHSPTVEGVHLRAGRIARGGLRWSDRVDDVRTEVLDLMKAQVLKNVLIVPTGAKGGFVLRRRSSERARSPTPLREGYEAFVRALLSVTDNRRSGRVERPDGVRRHDEDDPYLVVAADRGTATFSDLANEIAADVGFWLGDAFASGGSAGYDHKALGITALGAWAVARQHFAELGIDPEIDEVSVVGIGDMSGDVFGNGLLRSRTVRLVAAFDHRHVFLDPDPDPQASFDERARLYDLPYSSWDDYDRALLSEGGMIIPRALKQVELTDQVRASLRTDAEVATPAELIRAALTAPIDLLYAAGIGTFVRASDEEDADIGDRANDEVRVGADQLRARIVVEGGNLAVTQPGRIQYARRGGRINQDAIDNVAGVAISDAEVNLKILFTIAEERGLLERADRDLLLREITSQVVDRVLGAVDRQAWRIGADVASGHRDLVWVDRLLSRLEERRDDVDRESLYLPSSDGLAERGRARAGLARPEVATVVALAKRELAELAIESGLAADPALAALAVSSFPEGIMAVAGDLVSDFPLHAELVAARLSNDVVDRMGPTFITEFAAVAAIDLETALGAWWAAMAVLDLEPLWRQVDGFADLLGPERRRGADRVLADAAANLARAYKRDQRTLARRVADDRPALARVEDALTAGRLGTPTQRRARAEVRSRYEDDLVEPTTAARLAALPDLEVAPVIVAARVQRPELDPMVVADVALRLGRVGGFQRLGAMLETFETEDSWAAAQRRGLLTDLDAIRLDGVLEVVSEEDPADPVAGIEQFVARRRTLIDRALELAARVEEQRPRTLDAIAVAIRALGDALR